MRHSRWTATLGVAAGLVGVVTLAAGPASAHEQRQVGAYQMTVGWKNEPTYVGELNAVQLFIHDAKGQPVDDLGDPATLTVTAASGGKTSDPLSLVASWDPDTGLGNHGEFDAAIIPTAPGNYTFHFTGTINGQSIDQSFTSSERTFDAAEDPTGIQFPAKDPTSGELSTRVAQVQLAAGSARTRADSAGTTAVIGLAVGAAGLLVGAAGLFMALGVRRRPAT